MSKHLQVLSQPEVSQVRQTEETKTNKKLQFKVKFPGLSLRCLSMSLPWAVRGETTAAATAATVGPGVGFFLECKSEQPAPVFDSSAFAGPPDRRENQSAVRLFCLTSCSAPTESSKNSTGHMTETTGSTNRGPGASWQLEPGSTQRRGGEGLMTGNRAAEARRQPHWGCLPPVARMSPL